MDETQCFQPYQTAPLRRPSKQNEGKFTHRRKIVLKRNVVDHAGVFGSSCLGCSFYTKTRLYLEEH